MQLTEIKNDLATINYNPELNKLMLSDFILIEDSNQSILSQIISIEATSDNDINSAMLKFLLSIDKDANLTQYSGYVPSKKSTLILINPEEVIQLIKGNDKNIYAGNLALYPDIPVELNLDFIRKRPYIQADFIENKIQIVKSVIKGFEKNNKKVILLDFQGTYEDISIPAVKLGENFKLPLNYEALSYISEEELADCSNETKAILQGILLEVQNYVKTTEDKFIPFDTFISVLDAQYNESPIPELLLLKNKLTKYQQLGFFAQEKTEFDFLDSFLKDSKIYKIDLSELSSKWYKTALISILDIIKAKCYLITELFEENSSKAIVKKLYEKAEIKPVVISSYSYKYQLQLKAMSKNMVLFKPIQKVSDFTGYTSFQNILTHDTYIVWGEQTLFIPLILRSPTDNKFESKIKSLSFVNETQNSPIETEIVEDLSESLPEDEKQYIEPEEKAFDSLKSEDIIVEDSDLEAIENINSQVENIESIESHVPEEQVNQDVLDSVDEQVNESIETPLEEGNPETDNTLVEENPSNEEDIDLPNGDDLDFFFEEENDVETISSNDETETFEENIQDEDIESSEEEIIENFENVIINEELEQQDSINNQDESSDIEEPEQETDSPIEVHTENEVIEENVENDNKIEENTPAVPINPVSKTPNIPVYTSNVAPQFDTKFAQGTYVHHPKYGRGIVEKVTTYGNKELCMIIFDNAGRKLLDPNLAELKPI